LKPSLANLNETGMFTSERVHVREIVVIQGAGRQAGRPLGLSPDRLPFRGGVDISAATSINLFQGRNHGD
jgi:hypothetical protein